MNFFCPSCTIFLALIKISDTNPSTNVGTEPSLILGLPMWVKRIGRDVIRCRAARQTAPVTHEQKELSQNSR